MHSSTLGRGVRARLRQGHASAGGGVRDQREAGTLGARGVVRRGADAGEHKLEEGARVLIAC